MKKKTTSDATKQASNASTWSLVKNVGWPMFWGALATVGFYWCQRQGIIRSDFVQRYTAGHPVEVVEVGMFFVGLMFLLFRAWNIFIQLVDVQRVSLPEAHSTGDPVARTEELREYLQVLPHRVRSSYLVTRLFSALSFVDRNQSAADLDDELKYLSDMDAARAHDGYALPRIIIWATPMLGFLGTVMGITLALGDLSPEALVNSPSEAMEGLLAGLSVAFDTTALALTLSIGLMFIQFLVNQAETQLLANVDRRTVDLLGGRFAVDGIKRDPSVAVVESMCQTVLHAVDDLVSRQAAIWQKSMFDTHAEWERLINVSGEALKQGIEVGLQRVSSQHTQKMQQTELQAIERAAAYWEKIESTTREQSACLRQQQSEMAKQTQMLSRIIDASTAVATLERALNQNLKALAGAKNFEDTVMSLSAAVHLLSSRLSRPASTQAKVQLDTDKVDSKGRAA